MAEGTLQFNLSCVGAAESMRQLNKAARQITKVFRDLTDHLNPLWAALPGEWPDNFILLNRYLRTGVKPPFLFNE